MSRIHLEHTKEKVKILKKNVKTWRQDYKSFTVTQ